jgi:hypothetical protein
MAESLAVPKTSPLWFLPGDWDGCFALFFSGHPDLLLIAGLAPLCGFPQSMVPTRILPGAPLFVDELPIYGLIALSQGALLVSMIWTAAIAFMLDRRFLPAAAWLFAASALSCLGLIHAFRITDKGVETVIGLFAAPAFALGYLAGSAFLLGFHFYAARPGTVVAPGDVF